MTPSPHHMPQALSEAYRVLRPGGRFLCLEFSHVPNPLIRWYGALPLCGAEVVELAYQLE